MFSGQLQVAKMLQMLVLHCVKDFQLSFLLIDNLTKHIRNNLNKRHNIKAIHQYPSSIQKIVV